MITRRENLTGREGSRPREFGRGRGRPAATAGPLLGLFVAVSVAGAAFGDTPRAPQPPELVFGGGEAMATHARRLERFDRDRLLAVMRLVGLDEAGPPITVLLSASRSSLGVSLPDWVAGFAVDAETVVLFPERTPSYPHTSIEELLQHEVAHVLIARAAGGRRVPRWFHEGVALAAERSWNLGARADFAYRVAFGGAVPFSAVEPLFQGDAASVARAYALSNAFVQDLLEVHGPDLPAHVLRATRELGNFPRAFYGVTGTTVSEASEAFWQRRRLWVSWLPWITSPSTLYALMSLLALAAILRVRARRLARRRDDGEEHQAHIPPQDGEWPEEPPPTIH